RTWRRAATSKPRASASCCCGRCPSVGETTMASSSDGVAASVLGALHRRRLREIWRSAGWPCQDLIEVELLACGLLQRERDAAGRETLRVTDAGVHELAAT